MKNNIKLRKFHQAKWDEEVIFELHHPGERGVVPPEVEANVSQETGDAKAIIAETMQRETPPALPEVGQMRVLKHYLRLSQHTLGADINIDIGQGTCTMKYNPKINEAFVKSPKSSELHPLQDESTVQGALEIMHRLDLAFREISGMDYFSFQPSSGSDAIFTMASMVHKYLEVQGKEDQKDEIITTIFSHPSDYAAVSVKGFKVIMLYHDPETGRPSVEALKSALSERTAALFITNPEDTGIFNTEIKEFTRLTHEAGALCCYDQANANGILGITRAKEANFDMCFFNLHKTFASPHGAGGPASGALGVKSELVDFLPVPLIDFDGNKYSLNYDLKNSIGKVRSFYGVIPAVIRAYAWVMSLGAEGLEEVAKVAVLNNNYILEKIKKIHGASAPFAEGQHRIEQVRYSWQQLFEETGITIEDIAYRMADFGFHLWSSHHPFIVPQPFTIEPTESYSKQELDEYLLALEQIVKEARENPELVKTSPHNSVTHRYDETWLDDPEKWAISWRSYQKKHPEGIK